jgi:glyoxylase I family protein
VRALTGRMVVILTVSDLAHSERWYRELLALETHRYVECDGSIGQVTMHEPRTGLELCLVHHHDAPDEAFNEARIGLDHLEFLVERREDLDDWVARLDELGIAHSGVKTPPYTSNAMVTFRDPDNIQLEFFWAAPRPEPM